MISDLGKSISETLKKLMTSQITDSKIDLAIKDICTQLLSSNVSSKLIISLRNDLQEKAKSMPPGVDKGKLISKLVFDALVNLLNTSGQRFVPDMNKENVIVFVGLQGAGKTTTICKYANYYKKKGFKTGIICADTFRAGAFDQIKQNALKIKVPYYGSSEPNPVVVARNGLDKFRKDKFNMILIDTSGRHTQEKDLFEEMKDLVSEVTPSNIILVMDAGIGQIAEKQASGFKEEVNIGSIILTKIDGSKKAGGALSSVSATGCSIDFVGSGEAMEDFEVFNAQRFVSKMLGHGDLEGLAEKLQDIQFDEKEVLQKMQKGKFTIKDFYLKFQEILKLGPIGKLMEMIPGFSNMPEINETDYRRLFCIFDSMTEVELNSDGSVFEKEPTRIDRVASGSGNSTESVRNLMMLFKKMSGLMKKMSSNPAFASLMSGDTSKISSNQKAQLKNFAKSNLSGDLFSQMNSFLN